MNSPIWILALLISFASVPASFATGKKINCKIELSGHTANSTSDLRPDEIFILQVSNRVVSYGELPKSSSATYRLLQLQDMSAPDDAATTTTNAALKTLFAQTLGQYGIKPEDWESVERIQFLNKPRLGSEEFVQALHTMLASQGTPNAITEAQFDILYKLNDAADQAREKVKTHLFQLEENSFNTREHLLSEEEINDELRKYTHDSKYSLKSLGYAQGRSPISEWRRRLLIEKGKLQKAIKKSIFDSLKSFLDAKNEIPELSETLLVGLARTLKIGRTDINDFIGKGAIFTSTEDLIGQLKDAKPEIFQRLVDRRIFSEGRTQRMFDAIRNTDTIFFFKLAENQDLGNFAEIENMAKAQNAIIIVSPAFSELGLIPERLSYLFKNPLVHFQIDMKLQLTKDFSVINNGAADKVPNPFAGIITQGAVEPTDRVLVYSPQIKTVTNATGNYEIQPSYMMTTGSMSIPAYHSEFSAGMATDFKAQSSAEKNRGFTILSRGYRNEKINTITDGAYGMAPRRASYTESHFGNPAGIFDAGKIYTATDVFKLPAIPGIIWGDLHYGVTDPAFLKAAFDNLIQLGILKRNPKYGQPFEFEYIKGDVELGTLVLHDLIDGTPLNERIMDQLITRAAMTEKGMLDLESHLRSVCGFVNSIKKLLPDTVILVPSDNHGHDWIKKLMELGDLAKQPPKDLSFILRLMHETIEQGGNVYERVLSYYGLNLENTVFMDKADTYRIAVDIKNPKKFSVLQGVEAGQHTQDGINGGKSISISKLLAAYGALIGGHTHSTSEDGQAKRVATGTNVKQPYHKGPSSSDQSMAIAYFDDAVQILRLTKGTFLPNATTPQRPEEFFPNNDFPRVVPWPTMPEGGNTSDQFKKSPPVTRYRR